ncbi:MAG: LAGLIDADG family homing endonuclease [Candidatus Onthovivens sp.]|nr:LAGLIDADG family homing endonuclease [Candidatus Onthovivens sp.]
MPEEYIHHFIRGYFDGDGSISKYQKKENYKYSYHINIVGTQDFITKLYNYF